VSGAWSRVSKHIVATSPPPSWGVENRANKPAAMHVGEQRGIQTTALVAFSRGSGILFAFFDALVRGDVEKDNRGSKAYYPLFATPTPPGDLQVRDWCFSDKHLPWPLGEHHGNCFWSYR
jgi:hypothetical protein